MVDHAIINLNMKDVEARYLLREIELTLRSHRNSKANNPAVSNSLAKVLGDMYKSITGQHCPDNTQPHLNLEENISVNTTLLNPMDVKSLLSWVKYYLDQFQPHFNNGAPRNFNVLLGKVLNDMYRELTESDYPGFMENFKNNCNMLGNQIVRDIALNSDNMDPEYLRIEQKELNTLLEYSGKKPNTEGLGKK